MAGRGALTELKMPIYVYKPENPDDGAEEIERMFPKDPPDCLRVQGVYYRRTMVTRVAIVGLKPPPVQGDEVLQGYHAAECAEGSRFRSRFSADEINGAWRNDALTPLDEADPTVAAVEEGAEA